MNANICPSDETQSQMRKQAMDMAVDIMAVEAAATEVVVMGV